MGEGGLGKFLKRILILSTEEVLAGTVHGSSGSLLGGNWTASMSAQNIIGSVARIAHISGSHQGIESLMLFTLCRRYISKISCVGFF